MSDSRFISAEGRQDGLKYKVNLQLNKIFLNENLTSLHIA